MHTALGTCEKNLRYLEGKREVLGAVGVKTNTLSMEHLKTAKGDFTIEIYTLVNYGGSTRVAQGSRNKIKPQ